MLQLNKLEILTSININAQITQFFYKKLYSIEKVWIAYILISQYEFHGFPPVIDVL